MKVSPTPAPVVLGQGSGPYPMCHLCRGGDIPGNEAMVISMLYIGSGDCLRYFESGRRGELPTHLFYALQFFAYEPCGCGKSNQGGGSQGGKVRKIPDGEGKEGLKMSNQRGGAGGSALGTRRRGLKGERTRPMVETSN